MELTLITHTRDSASKIAKLEESTRWIPRRIAIDMESSDGTREFLEASGWEVITITPQPWRDEIRNPYLSLPQTEWTLLLDSDEYLASDAQLALSALLDSTPKDVVGYLIPRFNKMFGKVITDAGWYPDRQLRLFRTNSIEFQAQHHQPPLIKESKKKLMNLEPIKGVHIHHENYSSIAEFMERQQRYRLTDTYDSNPANFDFDSYQIVAHREFIARYDQVKGQEFGYPLALMMYWDTLMKGLIHWERTRYQGELRHHLPNQVYAEKELRDVLGDIHVYLERLSHGRKGRLMKAIGLLKLLNKLALEWSRLYLRR